MTTPFALAVRAALDEIDPLPGNEYWTVKDSNKLTEAILTYLIAYGLARAEAEDYEEAAGWVS